ncbi:MAG: hypothetical protein M5U12_26665 [Verrucomicrobia bacterium]|nr:hypothetical protein [Verrucomicrobiota bacterium]
MKYLQHLVAATLVLVLGAATHSLQAEPFLYVSDGAGSRLVKVDLGTGTVTDIGPFNQPGCFALAIHPSGSLYTATQGFPGSPDPRLARVDLATGDTTPFGVNLSPEIFMGLGFTPDGTLYGVNAASGTPDDGSLFRFDPATGAATNVKVAGSCGMIMDLAVHPDGTLYGVNPGLSSASTRTRARPPSSSRPRTPGSWGWPSTTTATSMSPRSCQRRRCCGWIRSPAPRRPCRG